jgi:hypothetical protein
MFASCGGTAQTSHGELSAASQLTAYAAALNAMCRRGDAGRPQGSAGGIYRVLKIGAPVAVPAPARPLVKRLDIALQASVAQRQNFPDVVSHQGPSAIRRFIDLKRRTDLEIAGLERRLGVTACARRQHPRAPISG